MSRPRGTVTRRGILSWRIKYDAGIDANTGERKTRYVTIKGAPQAAQRELTKLLAEVDAGILAEPTKITVEQHIQDWLDGDYELAPKTVERYRELARNQIYPHLGKFVLQALKPSHVKTWHKNLLKAGSRTGGSLAARTVVMPTVSCTRPSPRRPRSTSSPATSPASSHRPGSRPKRWRS